MTGSVALDVVIGLVFIYLLYSLLATILCEIIALHLGLRARNLQQAVRRMLEDSPQVSEVKLIAFFKHVWNNIVNQIHLREGPGTCVFYHLPAIKYLGRNTYYSKPSYITPQNFSKAIIEIFRRYGGQEDMPDLLKIQNVLKGALEYPGILKTIKEEIVNGTKPDPEKLDKPIDYVALRNSVEAKIKAGNDESLDEAQRKLFARIKKILDSKRTEKHDKAAIYKIDEMLNLFGHETRSYLNSLLKDANNDLVKFRILLEQWFNDTMERATGWYKQKVQFVLLIIGLVLAVWFNANTLSIVKTLSVDTNARDKLVMMATEYAKDPSNKISRSDVVDSVTNVRLDSLEKIRVKLQKEMDGANSLLGVGWKDLPDSLPLLALSKEDSLKKIPAERGVAWTKIKLDDKGKSQYRLLLHIGFDRNGILSCLYETKWWLKEETYTRFNKKMSRIEVDHGWIADLCYAVGHLFSSDGWGFLLTALAISLGAPFWFDMLNKLVQIRGVVKQPTPAQVNEGKSAAGSSSSDPSHVLNRKG